MPDIPEQRYIIHVRMFVFFALFFTLLLPVQIYCQADSSKQDLNFDFGITRGKNIYLWPLVKRYKCQEYKELQIMFSVYGSYQNYVNGNSSSHLFPWYFSENSEKSKDFRLISTFYPSLYHYNANKPREIQSYKLFDLAPKISMLHISRSADGLFVENNIFFFLLWKNDKKLKEAYFTLLPFFYWYSYPGFKNTTLFPFYSAGKTYHRSRERTSPETGKWEFTEGDSIQTSSFQVITPFYWHTESPGKSSHYLFPLWYYRKNITETRNTILPVIFYRRNDLYRSFTFFPVYSSGRSPDLSRSHLYLGGLIYVNRWQGGQQSVILPFWLNRRNSGQYWQSQIKMFFPFYIDSKFRYMTDLSFQNNRFLLPFLWIHENQSYRSTLIFPLLFHGRTADSAYSQAAVTPLYMKFTGPDTRRTFLFMGLFQNHHFEDSIRGKDKYIALPLFWQTKRWDTEPRFTETSRLLLPLFRSYSYSDSAVRKNSWVIFPIIWNIQNRYGQEWYTSNTIIFPVIYRLENEKHRSFTFLPLFSSGRSSDALRRHLMITPLYFQTSRPGLNVKLLHPIWYSARMEEQDSKSRINLLFPFYFSKHHDRPDYYENYHVIFPFVWNFRNSNWRSLTVFPFYSAGGRADSSKKYLAVTPFYYTYTGPGTQSTTALLLIRKSKYADSLKTIKRFTVFPVYWQNDEQLRLTKKETHNRVLFPVIWRLKNSVRIHFSIFPVVFYSNRYDELSKSFSVFPVYKNTINDRERLNRFLPLWQYRRYEDQFKTESKFTSLLYYKYSLILRKTGYAENTKSLLWIAWKSRLHYSETYALVPCFWHIKNFRDSSTTLAVLPLYWSKSTPDRQRTIVFPLLWYSSGPHHRSVTLLPLYSGSSDAAFGNSHTMITPFLWFNRINGRKHMNLIPLMSYSAKDSDKRFSLFYFLFSMRSDSGLLRTSLLWPLIDVTRKSASLSWRAAPLLWYSRSEDKKMFSLIPAFYYSKKNHSKTFNLFWLLYHYRRDDSVGTSHNILWKFFSSDRYANGDYETRLLYKVYSNVRLLKYREKSVFPFYHWSIRENGDENNSYMFGFYNKFRQKIPDSEEYYYEDRIFWFIRLRSNYESLNERGIKVR